MGRQTLDDELSQRNAVLFWVCICEIDLGVAQARPGSPPPIVLTGLDVFDH